jgi:hypothetical protein
MILAAEAPSRVTCGRSQRANNGSSTVSRLASSPRANGPSTRHFGARLPAQTSSSPGCWRCQRPISCGASTQRTQSSSQSRGSRALRLARHSSSSSCKSCSCVATSTSATMRTPPKSQARSCAHDWVSTTRQPLAYTSCFDSSITSPAAVERDRPAIGITRSLTLFVASRASPQSRSSSRSEPTSSVQSRCGQAHRFRTLGPSIRKSSTCLVLSRR